MARVNVFLPDDLLKAVDAETEQAGTKRSALIQKALESFLQAQRTAREEAKAQRRMDEACKRMDALAERLVEWNPTPIIRQFRDSRYGGGRPQGRTSRARTRS